jgi:hypothetical protein
MISLFAEANENRFVVSRHPHVIFAPHQTNSLLSKFHLILFKK